MAPKISGFWIDVPRPEAQLAFLILVSVTLAQLCVAQEQTAAADLVPRTMEVLDLGYKLPIEISGC